MLVLVSLILCHYLADFCLTWPELIQSKTSGRNAWPIMQHAAVHALLMGVCLLMCGICLWMSLLMMAFEWVTHFLIDTGKARLSVVFPMLADARHKPYWMLYGLDQLLHQLVIVLIWYFVLFEL